MAPRMTHTSDSFPPASGRTSVVIVAPPNVLASAVAGLHDVLAAAGTIWPFLRHGVAREPIFDVTVASNEAGIVDCHWDMQLVAAKSLSDIKRADIVVLPAFMLELPRGPKPEFKGPVYEELRDWVTRMYQQGSKICSTSTGSIFLAEIGLLEGAEATTHWALAESMSKWYPEIPLDFTKSVYYLGKKRRVRVAGGGTCWQDLAIQLISEEAGPQVAAQTARSFTIFGQRSGQLPFTEWQPIFNHADQAISRAQMWIDEQYHQPDAIAGAKEASNLTDRTFKRRFKFSTGLPPTTYLQRVRISEARMLLETTNMSVEDIAARVGYHDTGFFRSLFKKIGWIEPCGLSRAIQPFRRKIGRSIG